MTKKEMFVEIANACADNEEIVAFCEHEIELIENRKARKSSKPSKTQVENEGIKSEILSILEGVDTPVTATEIKDELNAGYAVQKVSALLSQLVKAEKVVKTYSGKVAMFARA